MAAPVLQAIAVMVADQDPHVDLVVTMPAHATGDVLVVMAMCRNTAETATISGWTLFTGFPINRSTVARYWLWWKRAASGAETATVDFTGTAGDAYAVCAAYRGAVASGDPWEVVGTATTGTADPASLPEIITLTADSLVVVPLMGEDNNNASIITTGTDPAGYTEHYDESTIGADAMVGFSEAARTSAGATGAVSVNFNVAVPVGWCGIVVALKPPTAVTHDGQAGLTADGALVTAGSQLLSGQSALTADTVLAGAGSRLFGALAAMSADGTLAAVGAMDHGGRAVLSADAVLVALASVSGVQLGQAALSADGTITAAGSALLPAQAVLDAGGSLGAVGSLAYQGAAVLTGDALLAALAVLTLGAQANLITDGIIDAAGTVTPAGSGDVLGAAELSGLADLTVVATVDLYETPRFVIRRPHARG